MSNIDALKERCHNLVLFIEEANDKIRIGEVMDLTNLEQNVSALCLEIESADPGIAVAMKEDMARMITKLDELAAGLTAFQQQQAEKQ